jgi:membrane protease YdiL (CAAX protease family)
MDAAAPEEKPGQLLWIAAPVVISLLLRAFARDGWKDLGIRPNLRGNWAWYAVSVLFYPLCVALIVALGLGARAISFQNVAPDLVALFVQTWIGLLVREIVLNILKEFAFRGYLAPKLYSLGLNVWIAHVLVGLIWGIWHLPYLRAITPYCSESFWTLVPRFLAGTMAASLVYGEIRLRTRSVWPAVLMQIAGGTTISAVMLSGLISVKPAHTFRAAPVLESVLMIVLFVLAGIGLHAWRMNCESSRPTSKAD